jgi:hypothetical protein
MDHQITATNYKEQCIPPTKENSRTAFDVERMFNSHQWQLLKAESQLDDTGVLIRMSCSRCNAQKVAILQTDE